MGQRQRDKPVLLSNLYPPNWIDRLVSDHTSRTLQSPALSRRQPPNASDALSQMRWWLGLASITGMEVLGTARTGSTKGKRTGCVLETPLSNHIFVIMNCN